MRVQPVAAVGADRRDKLTRGASPSPPQIVSSWRHADCLELPNLEDLSAAELRSLAVSLLGTVAQLEAKVAALSEEIARLKRLKGRPNLKPSGMEKGHRYPTGPVRWDWSPEAGGIRGRPRARG